MKKLIFLALLLGFLTGNAQQDRLQFSADGSRTAAQIYSGINPGFPAVSDLNKDKIRKTDNAPGYPIAFDEDRYTIRKPDNTSYPMEFNINRYSIRKPDNFNPGYPSEVELNRHSIRKPD